MQKQPSLFLKEALEYADRGWYVIPHHGITPEGECTCYDPECKVQGKHPRMERESEEGFLRGIGSNDHAKISEWWQTWPESNVSIVCGSDSNLVAIDIDPRNGGFESWKELMASHGDYSNTLSVKTGGGGLHLIFQHPQGVEKIRNRIGLRPGIDVKGDGGRITAPPSRHKSGINYEWVDSSKRPIPLPDWLLHMIQFEKGTGTWTSKRRNGR